MTTPKFLQIHTLHSYPAALLNRDDSGLPSGFPSARRSAPAFHPSASSVTGGLPRMSFRWATSPAAPRPCARGTSLNGK